MTDTTTPEMFKVTPPVPAESIEAERRERKEKLAKKVPPGTF